MQRFLIIPIMLMAMTMSGCKKVVEGFNVVVGQNDVTAVVELAKDFALSFNGSFPIVVNDVEYATLFLNGATSSSPFTVGATANLDMFTSEVWEGFGTTTTLPNGDALPGWITPYELVAVDIPSFSPHFDLIAYVGYQKPYYLGVAVTLKVLDAHFPEGLGVSQSFKKDSKPWGTVQVFGPTRDADGNVTQSGGVFFVASFDPLIPGIQHRGPKAMAELESEEIQFHGPRAEEYRNDKKKQRQAMKQIRKVLEMANSHLK